MYRASALLRAAASFLSRLLNQIQTCSLSSYGQPVRKKKPNQGVFKQESSVQVSVHERTRYNIMLPLQTEEN